MQEVKNKVAGIFAFLVLIGVTIIVALLAWMAVNEDVYVLSAVADVDINTAFGPPEEPRAKFIWTMFLDLVQGGKTGAVVFVSAITLVSIAAQFLSSLHKNALSLYIIAALCTIGFAASWVLKAYAVQGETLASLLSLSEMKKGDFVSNVNWLTGGLIGWFVAFLAVQLGISLKKPAGVLNGFFGNGQG